MSTRGCYRRVTAAELEVLHAEPLALGAFLFPPGDLPPPVDRHLDVGDAWQAIHFLLTGDPWGGGPPFANAVLGGDQIGEEDLGQGPARFQSPEGVASVAAALQEVPPAEFIARFDAAALNSAEVYPGAWRDDPAARAGLEEQYAAVRELFTNAAAAGDGMILYLT